MVQQPTFSKHSGIANGHATTSGHMQPYGPHIYYVAKHWDRGNYRQANFSFRHIYMPSMRQEPHGEVGLPQSLGLLTNCKQPLILHNPIPHEDPCSLVNSPAAKNSGMYAHYHYASSVPASSYLSLATSFTNPDYLHNFILYLWQVYLPIALRLYRSRHMHIQ